MNDEPVTNARGAPSPGVGRATASRVGEGMMGPPKIG